MRFASIPPPMALHDLCLSENAIDVAVSIPKSEEHYTLIAVLQRDGIAMYELDVTAKPPKPPSSKWFTKVVHPEAQNSVYRQVSFSHENKLSVLLSDTRGSLVCALDTKTGLMNENVFFFPQDIRGLVPQGPIINSKSVLVLTKDHVIEPSVPKDNPYTKKSQLGFPLLRCQSPRVEVVSFRQEIKEPGPDGNQLLDYSDNAVFFGLSSNGCLFVNKRLLASNCTSFLVTPAHLIFTTSNHLLKFVHMAGVEG